MEGRKTRCRCRQIYLLGTEARQIFYSPNIWVEGLTFLGIDHMSALHSVEASRRAQGTLLTVSADNVISFVSFKL